MAEAKIEIKVGAVTFSGEGEGDWLSKQLDKVLAKLPELTKVQPASSEDQNGAGTTTGSGAGGAKAAGTLASYLKDKKATTNQVRKFLATAVWLTDNKDLEDLTTTDVTKALSDAKQTALSNASQCLANNVKQGYCQKVDKKRFFVTDDGRNSLG